MCVTTNKIEAATSSDEYQKLYSTEKEIFMSNLMNKVTQGSKRTIP